MREGEARREREKGGVPRRARADAHVAEAGEERERGNTTADICERTV